MVASLSTVPTTARVARAKAFLARHQLTAFIVLAFAWSWSLAWIGPLVPGGAGPVFQFGPPLAAMLIAEILDPAATRGTRPRRSILFGLVAVSAVIVWVSFFTFVVVQDHTLALYGNGALVAALAGLVVSGPLAGGRGVRALLQPLFLWRVSWRWYAVALLLLPATFLLGMGLAVGLGEKLPPYPHGDPSALWILAVVWIAFFGGGMEEAGWRGFALPRLQHRYSPLVASLILSCIWAAWHTPEYFNGFYTGAAAGSSVVGALLVRFLLFTPPLAVLMTWAYNGARGSLLIVVLMHAAYNTASFILPLSNDAYALAFIVQWIVAIAVVVSARMWRRTPADRPGAPAISWPAIGQQSPVPPAPVRSERVDPS